MATKPYRNFYIICQDYVFGHDVAKTFKEQIKRYIPDAEIVGENFHPVRAKEFGPYITKIKSAGADVVFCGSWGSDGIELVRQARSLGLKAPFPIAFPSGVAPCMGSWLKEDSVGIHTAIGYTMHVNTPENKAMIAKYHEQHKDDELIDTRWPTAGVGQTILGWQMVFAAVEKAGSLDPGRIIEAFEGFWYKTCVGWWHMRKCDHQVILPMFGGVFASGKNPYFDIPWLGPNMIPFPATESAIPPTSDYNPRCP
jgi:ABC-type branched-subunit amino acid transport system substrate-binding protein